MHWGVAIAYLEWRQAIASTGDDAFALCFEVDGDSLSVTETEDLSE